MPHALEMRMVAVCSALLAGTSCATIQQGQSAAVFASPSNYVGEEVVVCGWLLGVSNILQDRDEADVGLSILVGDKLSNGVRQLSQRTHACVSGRIEHLGCGSAICTDWAYDYAIRGTRIL